MILGGKVVHPLVETLRSLEPEVVDLLTASLLNRMRDALLQGEVVTVPGVGRLSVRGRRRYGVTHPTSGETAMMGGELTVVFQPDRLLVRDLNSPSDPGDQEIRHEL